MDDIAEALGTAGYAVMPQVIEPSLVRHLRGVLLRWFGSGRPARFRDGLASFDPFNDPDLTELLVLLENRPILETLRKVIGPELCYCNHSAAFCNVATLWHRDHFGIDGRQGAGPEGYALYKVMLYLQDHKHGAGALRVKPGSHRADTAMERTLHVAAGDAILFDLRLLHCGTERTVLPMPIDWVLRRVLRRLPNRDDAFAVRRFIRRLHAPEDRLLVSFVFGRANAYSRMHLEKFWQHQRALGAHHRPPSDTVVATLGRLGIRALDVDGVVRGTEIPRPIPAWSALTTATHQ
ncbi:MAG: phytanoyl-CoA dioxygenase family protein [Gammaproteobacteria bacterium]|nr:phytanoyl-CoA dioxygenase family protein [Gammaproteobacteria bacterium]